VKTRGGNHSKEIREYIISDSGLRVMDTRLDEHRALTTGLPESGAPAPTKYMN
jgi:circadian clock protein KaiC